MESDISSEDESQLEDDAVSESSEEEYDVQDKYSKPKRVRISRYFILTAVNPHSVMAPSSWTGKHTSKSGDSKYHLRIGKAQ